MNPHTYVPRQPNSCIPHATLNLGIEILLPVPGEIRCELANPHLNVEPCQGKAPKPEIALARAHRDLEFHGHVVV